MISQHKISDDGPDALTERTSFYKNLSQAKGATDTSLNTPIFFNTENDTVLEDYEQSTCKGLLTPRST